MGVWIETQHCMVEIETVASHPVWVCGLKLAHNDVVKVVEGHTLYGCVD